MPDLPIGNIDLSLGPQDPRGPQKTVVRVESMAGVCSFRLNFVKNLCLNYYSRNLVLFIFCDDNAKSSNEFPWISISLLVKLHANYCVDILKARWLRPAFAESYWLLRVTLSKEVVTVHVRNTPDQWHNWRVPGVRPPSPVRLNVETRPLPSLYIGIYYSFGFSRLFSLRFLECFPVISGFRLAV